MSSTRFYPRTKRALRRDVHLPLLRERRGLSVILVAIVLVVLIAFVSMAVDMGRVRVAKVQLQNAADAAATAGALALETLPGGVVETQDQTYEAAAENFNIDTRDGGGREDRPVDLVVDEDVEFGRWIFGSRTFVRLEQLDGGIDERRQANAVRVWGRRVTQYVDPVTGDSFQRGTGLPLIFAPVIGKHTGEIQVNATAAFGGGRHGYGFIGIDSVFFNGTTKTDSYNAATETYPGADGPNKNSAISSDGDIRLVGGTQIWGDVHPGVDHQILPYPLGGNVEVTGYMDPLDEPLPEWVKTLPPFVPPFPPEPYNDPKFHSDGIIKGANPGRFESIGMTDFKADPSRGAQGKQTYFYFQSNGNQYAWSSGSQDRVYSDNTHGPITFFIDGNLKNSAQAEIHIVSNNHPVTFNVNGNFDMQGGGIVNDAGNSASTVKPEILKINITKAGTTVDIGGSPTMGAHIMAPGSELTFHGNGQGTNGFYGWAIGQTLTVNGNFELHYDESNLWDDIPKKVRLVD